MTDFYVSPKPFTNEHGGLYVGRWIGPQVERRGLTHLGLGNPFRVDNGRKHEATLKLINAFLDNDPHARAWMNRVVSMRDSARLGTERKLVCHCEADQGCHAWLIARLFNDETNEDWVLQAEAHRAILGEQLQLL